MSAPKNRLAALTDLIVLALFGALMIVLKEAMSFLPNIEPVSLFCAVCSVLYGKRSLISVYIFVLIQGLLYGFHIWWINYLYIWPLCCLAAQILRKADSAVVCALVMGIFGLLFGTLTAIPYLFVGGIQTMIGYIASGLLFDISHCISNFLICLLLYRPLIAVLRRVLKKVPTTAYLD